MNKDEFEELFCKNGWVYIPVDLWNKTCAILGGLDNISDELYEGLQYFFTQTNKLQ